MKFGISGQNKSNFRGIFEQEDDIENPLKLILLEREDEESLTINNTDFSSNDWNIS